VSLALIHYCLTVIEHLSTLSVCLCVCLSVCVLINFCMWLGDGVLTNICRNCGSLPLRFWGGRGRKKFLTPKISAPLRPGPQYSQILGVLAAPMCVRNFTSLHLYAGDPETSEYFRTFWHVGGYVPTVWRNRKYYRRSSFAKRTCLNAHVHHVGSVRDQIAGGQGVSPPT